MNIGSETEQIEFKKSTSETKEGIISIASILNKHQKGSLYFGVRDDGEVTGQEVGRDTLRYLSRNIRGNIEPPCWYSVEEKWTYDGKCFIEVQFSGTDGPYSAYGRYYQRFADEDNLISDTELERLFRMRQKDYSFWENESSDESVSDVDHDLLKKEVSEGEKSGRMKTADDLKAEAVLSKFGLITENGTLNNAGKVLFSKNGPILLKLAAFATETKMTFLDLDHFEGNVYECIEEGVRYISSSIRWRVEFTGEVRRKEIPEIPMEAVREIVVNAFAHGMYAGNTAFEIEIFKDRVEIYSPGLFPAGFTPEDFAEHAEEPISLNPKIVNVLFKTGVIESFGSGFARTFEACRKAGVRYEYRNTKSGFRFIFFRRNDDGSFGTLSKTERAVYEALKKNNMATAKMIAEETGKSLKTVYRAIAGLKQAGLISRSGSDYNGHWNIE